MSEASEQEAVVIGEIAEKYTEAESVPQSDNSDAHRVSLSVGCQYFIVGGEMENREHADWFRRQLGIALEKIIDEQQHCT